jgi:hypothetical protein
MNLRNLILFSLALSAIGCSRSSDHLFFSSGELSLSRSIDRETIKSSLLGFIKPEFKNDINHSSGAVSISVPMKSFANRQYAASGEVSTKRSIAPRLAELLRYFYDKNKSLCSSTALETSISANNQEFSPGENETWIEIDSKSKKVRVFRGKSKIKEFLGEGEVIAQVGLYSLQHKQKNPLWYAPDDYFLKRKLSVPPAEDRIRYRRGALGDFVIYPTTTFPIHSSPVLASEVGGLRVNRADLSAVYYMLPIGTAVIIK